MSEYIEEQTVVVANAKVALHMFRSGQGDQEQFNYLIFLQRFIAKLPLRHKSWSEFKQQAEKMLVELELTKQRHNRTEKWGLSGDGITIVQTVLDNANYYCGAHLPEQVRKAFYDVRDEYNKEVREARRQKRMLRLKGIKT